MHVNPIKMAYITISSDDILEILPFFFIVCAVIMIICYFIVRSVEAKNNKFPVKEETAKIIDLRQETALGIASVTWILFELVDGDRIRLATDIKNDFMLGDSGILKYQGERLISFTRGEVKKNDMHSKNKIQPPKIEVTEEEIRYLMEKKNIPYAKAALLVTEIKLKQWEKRRETHSEKKGDYSYYCITNESCGVDC